MAPDTSGESDYRDCSAVHRRGQSGGNYGDDQPLTDHDFKRAHQVDIGETGLYVTAGPDGKVDAVETHLPDDIAEFRVLDLDQILGEDDNRRGRRCFSGFAGAGVGACVGRGVCAASWVAATAKPGVFPGLVGGP